MAQFGVIFLLFALGLEFSTTKVSFFAVMESLLSLPLYIKQVMVAAVTNHLYILQLRVVRAVAVLGGLLQILLFMCLCGIISSVCPSVPLIFGKGRVSNHIIPSWVIVTISVIARSLKSLLHLW